MTEAQMSPIVSRWLIANGYTPFAEVPVGHGIDLVGIRDDEIIAVELKRCMSLRVYQQALRNQLFVHLSFAAVQARPRKPRDLKGIGVLIVTDTVEVHAEAVRVYDYPLERYLSRLRTVCSCRKPGGIGGLPGGAAVSPAKDAAAVVWPMKLSGLTWRQVWERFPAHYCNAKSMAGAMKRYRPE